jgi:PadR family transcriptional regulator PadR
MAAGSNDAHTPRPGRHAAGYPRHARTAVARPRPAHGYTIARLIQQRSDHLLHVGQGSLYPALHRLETRKWITSFWGTSENNRKARYYRLTPAGRQQLAAEASKWKQLVHAIGRVMRPIEEP